jgi:hypothetical protein
MFGALKSEDALALGPRDDQGVDLAPADSVQSFFRLLQAAAKFIEFESDGGGSRFHFDFPWIEWPEITLSRSYKTPTNRRVGCGSSLMSVGAAMISASLARQGSW